MNITLSRSSFSLDIPVLESGEGTPLIAVDVGRPNQQIRDTGGLDPKPNDFRSGVKNYAIFGRFHGSGAFTDAIQLGDLIKSNANGNLLNLDIPLNEFDNNISVVPSAGSESAVSLTYNSGYTNTVFVQLTVTRVSSLQGSYSQPANIPTSTGSGPLELSDNSNTVSFSTNLNITRNIGRPNSTVRAIPNQKYPKYVDNHKTAYDAFEISTRYASSSYLSNMTDLAGMFDTSLGYDTLDLDFNGLFGMGSFPVVPEGTNSLRHNRSSAQEGTIIIPNINLRRVA